MAAFATVKLDDKGRVGLPASIRADAGLDSSDALVAVVVGPGRILLETRAAIQRAVWEAAPGAVAQDATSSIRELRRGDAEMSDANIARRARQQAPTQEESEARGEELLRALGL